MRINVRIDSVALYWIYSCHQHPHIYKLVLRGMLLIIVQIQYLNRQLGTLPLSVELFGQSRVPKILLNLFIIQLSVLLPKLLVIGIFRPSLVSSSAAIASLLTTLLILFDRFLIIKIKQNRNLSAIRQALLMPTGVANYFVILRIVYFALNSVNIVLFLLLRN